MKMSRHGGAGLSVLLFLVLGADAPAETGDVTAGRRKAFQCQTCHGLDGISKLPEAPHLAGQPEQYLVT
jgi:cytochrome c553